jgi:uncharacterized protein (DUF1330 family)
MATYCLFQNLEITDPDKMKDYVSKVFPLTSSYGGQYVVSGGEVELKEGEWTPIWPVMIKFPNMEKARAWYDSEEYQPLKALRKSAGRFSAVFMEGI